MKTLHRVTTGLLARFVPAAGAAAAVPCLSCKLVCKNGLINNCCTDRCLGTTRCTPRREQC